MASGSAGGPRPRTWDVLVIGGGPAGLLAAGRAAMLGARVLLLEKMEKPARKLRITGKGRCNLTNLRPLEEHLKAIHPEPRFLRQAFGAFFHRELIDLLRDNGVETKVERGDRVFPASDRAWDVAEALVAWARRQGVEIVNQARVERLLLEDGAFAGVVLERGTGPGQRLEARCGIVATGGLSYPATGSTGDGHRFAAAAGLQVTGLLPSLVGIDTVPAHPAAAGLNLRNVELALWIDGRKTASEFGETEFTGTGLGGPIVLKLSRRIVAALAAGRKVAVTLDLKPALEPLKLEARLARELEARAGASCADLLRALVPAQLVDPLARRLSLDPAAPAALVAGPRRRRLLGLLKELPFEVCGHGGWESAIVTAGGVALQELDPRTMAARRVGNLYFAGEVVDLDGNTGGYNLQIAFSTGWLAGSAAAARAAEAGPREPSALFE